MQIYNIRSHSKYPKLSRAVIALGSFDGVHRGHQKIIQTGINLAKRFRSPFGVITFMPIPPMLIYKDFNFVLSTDTEKINMLRELNVDFLGKIRFSRHLRNFEPSQFIIQYITQTINPSVIVIGHDCHFGKGHKGNVTLLAKLGKELGYSVKVVSSLKYHNAPIKSTRIRELIILGNVARAKDLLGRPYSMTGIIIKGKGLAKQLGFPTLNLHISQKEKLIPADGVYQVRARFENKNHDGVMNIGFAPTIPDKLKANQLRSLEIHLFDYQESGLSHFNEQVMVEFITRIRPERKFDNIEQLKQQIACDIKIVKETLN
jgi:riboflavin kinase/FMN adenylyltransferase